MDGSSVTSRSLTLHLTQESRESGNRRNGKKQKLVQTPVGDITVTTPRDFICLLGKTVLLAVR